MPEREKHGLSTSFFFYYAPVSRALAFSSCVPLALLTQPPENVNAVSPYLPPGLNAFLYFSGIVE